MCTLTKDVQLDARIDDNGQPYGLVATDALEVFVGRSEIDGSAYVIIDTIKPGSVRIDLNDGTIWDQDPDIDVPEMLDQFSAGANHIVCRNCKTMIDTEPTLRAQLVAARTHVCEETP